MFYKDETIAVLIDGTSLYAASRGLGFDIDYKMLRQEFVRRGKLCRICFYTIPLLPQNPNFFMGYDAEIV